MERRTFVAGAASVGVALTAGCLSSVGLGGSAYSDWFYAPGTVEDDDHRTVAYVDTAILDDRSSDMGTFGEVLGRAIDAALDGSDLDVDDTEWAVAGNGFAFSITESVDEVRDDLEDNDYEEDDEKGGYTIYTRDASAFAVTEGYLLSSGILDFGAGFGSGGEDVVEAMVEAEIGETERYQDENEDFRAVLDATDPALFATLQTFVERDETVARRGRFEGSVASSTRVHLPDPEGDAVEFTSTYVFDDASDVDDLDEGGFEDYVEEEAAGTELDDVTVQRNGRLLSGTGTADVDDVF